MLVLIGIEPRHQQIAAPIRRVPCITARLDITDASLTRRLIPCTKASSSSAAEATAWTWAAVCIEELAVPATSSFVVWIAWVTTPRSLEVRSALLVLHLPGRPPFVSSVSEGTSGFDDGYLFLEKKRRKPMLKQALVLVIVVALTGCGEDDKNDFVRKATESGQFEITSSELAQDKSKRDDVKKFAAQMIADHTAAAKKLDQVAAEAKVTPKEKGVGEKTEYTDELEDLQKASDFDKEYIDKQVDAHEDAVKLFESYARDGDDAKLKKFAAETLPTLKGHLEHSKSLQGK